MSVGRSVQARLLTCLVVACLGRQGKARADVVTDWNATLLQAVKAENTPPPRAAHTMAMVHVAMYDAVNGIRRTHEHFAVAPGAPPTASAEAAAAEAAHDVLASRYPMHVAMFDAQRAASLSVVSSGSSKAEGIAWGRRVAEELLLLRADDGSRAELPYRATVDPKPGQWKPTFPRFARDPLLPGWGNVKPFAIRSPDEFTPAPLPALTSARWAADFKETKSLGERDSVERTGEQTLVALFWADGIDTVTPPGHWNQIARSVAAARGNTLEENARLFALLNMAMADAGICAWRVKYESDFWRPVTAIREAETDGNPATIPDPAWTPLLLTPPFPECVSGHSAFSAAAAALLADWCGSDEVAFVTTSDALPGVRRHFKRFSDAAAEAGMSRILGGIHFRTANVEGRALGAAVGHHVAQQHLARLPARAAGVQAEELRSSR